MIEGAQPDPLLRDHLSLFVPQTSGGPILDLACGNGHNGLFLASQGLPVILADISEEALDRAGKLAEKMGVEAAFWQVDLEKADQDPLEADFFSAIVVFRYLHRPLIPYIRKALKKEGVLVYETYTLDQARFGKPHNPDFLLKPGELSSWFEDWEIAHYFEGIKQDPERAIAQIVCRKRE